MPRKAEGPRRSAARPSGCASTRCALPAARPIAIPIPAAAPAALAATVATRPIVVAVALAAAPAPAGAGRPARAALAAAGLGALRPLDQRLAGQADLAGGIDVHDLDQDPTPA